VPSADRWLYRSTVGRFLKQPAEEILGTLFGDTEYSVRAGQRDAWVVQIALLRTALASVDESAVIYFEFVVPRIGKRIDVVLLLDHVVFVIEFKVGEKDFTSSALDQVWDYALDLRNFHESSHAVCIAPVLIATEAKSGRIQAELVAKDTSMLRPICAGRADVVLAIRMALTKLKGLRLAASAWEAGRYLPTPTIVEAARALYAGHAVQEISRSDAGAKNLIRTSAAVDHVISESRALGRKSICFVTGVPGAGKTLVGLDVATRHRAPDSSLHSVFLSGNGPLVAVLREALARDEVHRKSESGEKIRKGDAVRRVSTFIQNVHHFRDESLRESAPPPEHVALFDEAQRAWNVEQTRSFMLRKKGVSGFEKSEPEFLISCLDRHPDWSVIVCLVGGGQEINTGEGGISEWIDAILRSYPEWHVHLSPRLAEAEYGGGCVPQMIQGRGLVHWSDDLHLATSMRSFRAENLSDFVKLALDLEVELAKAAFSRIAGRYPVVISRSLVDAKLWLKEQASGSERYGMVVSSQAYRLRPHAIDVRAKLDPVHWFLHDKADVRSSYYLEDAATEFQIQGLELDWSCVVWDGDLRFTESGWAHHEFVGTAWRSIRQSERQRYQKNAYRVLLTRARQGMVIVVPEGDATDPTRSASNYDPTFAYLKSLGIPELKAQQGR
jgi:hypothetical protein